MPSELFSIEYRYTDTQHNITQYRVLLRWYHSELNAVMIRNHSVLSAVMLSASVVVLTIKFKSFCALVLCTGLLICKIVLFPFENAVITTVMAPQQ